MRVKEFKSGCGLRQAHTNVIAKNDLKTAEERVLKDHHRLG